nr:MAG TPA: hypothetical protein [Caudoviricetes sp.]
MSPSDPRSADGAPLPTCTDTTSRVPSTLSPALLCAVLPLSKLAALTESPVKSISVVLPKSTLLMPMGSPLASDRYSFATRRIIGLDIRNRSNIHLGKIIVSFSRENSLAGRLRGNSFCMNFHATRRLECTCYAKDSNPLLNIGRDELSFLGIKNRNLATAVMITLSNRDRIVKRRNCKRNGTIIRHCSDKFSTSCICSLAVQNFSDFNISVLRIHIEIAGASNSVTSCVMCRITCKDLIGGNRVRSKINKNCISVYYFIGMLIIRHGQLPPIIIVFPF